MRNKLTLLELKNLTFFKKIQRRWLMRPCFIKLTCMELLRFWRRQRKRGCRRGGCRRAEGWGKCLDGWAPPLSGKVGKELRRPRGRLAYFTTLHRIWVWGVKSGAVRGDVSQRKQAWDFMSEERTLPDDNLEGFGGSFSRSVSLSFWSVNDGWWWVLLMVSMTWESRKNWLYKF